MIHRNPLIDAAKYIDEANVEALLAAGVDPNVADESGFTPIHAASWMGDDGEHGLSIGRIIATLLRHGADPQVRDSEGYTALHHAVESDAPSATAVEMLLAAGADPNARDNADQTPLLAAAAQAGQRRILECIWLLLAAGAERARPDGAGKTALDLAEESVSRWEATVAAGPEALPFIPSMSPEDIAATHLQALERAREVGRLIADGGIDPQ